MSRTDVGSKVVLVPRMGKHQVMDAITMLKNDHQTVEKLFKEFEAAGDRAHVEKRQLVNKMIEELSVHAAIEEMLFYPVTDETVPDIDDDVLQNLEEHHVVKWLLAELDGLDPEAERFDAKVHVLIANVRHHVEEEEGDYFRAIRDELGRKALSDLGERMEAARAVAPTHPHPNAPDTAPANMITGTGAGIVDRLGDTVSGIAQGSASAVGDIVDRVRGNERRQPSPAGSSTTRSTANSLREGANEALDRAVAAVKEAKDTGERVTKASRTAGAKTAKSAKTAAKRTTGTARSAAEQTADAAETAAKRTTGTARQASKSADSSKRAAKRTTGTARQAAQKVAETAEAGAKQTVGTARQSTKETAKTARAGAKKVAKTAKKSTKATKKRS